MSSNIQCNYIINLEPDEISVRDGMKSKLNTTYRVPCEINSERINSRIELILVRRVDWDQD